MCQVILEFNLLAVIVLISGIFTLKSHFGKIYNTNAVDHIEMACYLNIGNFSATQLFLLREKLIMSADSCQ